MEVPQNVASRRARRHINDCIERARGWPIFEILWEQEFSPTERRSLGCTTPSAAYKKYGVPQAWQKLRGHEGARAAVEILFALGGLDRPLYEWLLRELGEDESWNVQVERAVNSGALVLVEGEMEASWDGNAIECEWSKHPRLWAFLVAIARAAKRYDALDQLLISHGDSGSVLKHRKANLLKLSHFPESLAALIRPAGRGSYQLNLEPERIRIFEQVGVDDYRELIR